MQTPFIFSGKISVQKYGNWHMPDEEVEIFMGKRASNWEIPFPSGSERIDWNWYIPVRTPFHLTYQFCTHIRYVNFGGVGPQPEFSIRIYRIAPM